MAKKSAGLLMFRCSPDGQVQVLLVHPGGPVWAKKDRGAWSIPKGEYDDSEDALEAAKREFAEETGFPVSEPFISLGSLRQPSGKTVSVWAFKSDCDPAALVSNEFEMEWPPKSGRKASFVEIDRAGWFSLEEARERLAKGQVGFVEGLHKAVSCPGEEG
ncbi:MAG: NUDIX domain-containing protein [Pseudomonadota bacterium]|nr:NUDIX domain-containing protein [Pseudomonadota bacterium]